MVVGKVFCFCALQVPCNGVSIYVRLFNYIGSASGGTLY